MLGKLKLIPPQYRALLIVAFLAAVAFGGWMVRGWYEDSLSLAKERATQAAFKAALEHESTVAAKVEEKLAGLRANERVIDRGVVREIVKPEYRNVCLPPDGLQLLNAAAAGVPGDAAERVPKDPSPVQRRDGGRSPEQRDGVGEHLPRLRNPP